MQTPKTEFSYVTFGEIIPPVMVGGIDPDEMLREMMGEETFNAIPVQEHELFYGSVAIYAQQKQMEKVFAGQTDGIEGGAELYRAALGGAMISLRPLGHENERYTTFAPVFQRIADGIWQVGLKTYGTKIAHLNEADSLKAYLQARELYAAWAEAAAETQSVAAV